MWLAFRRLLTVLAVLVLLGLALFVSRRPTGPGTGRSLPDRPASPEQARTQELFRLNANLPSDPALASAYQVINTEYFESRLPAVGIRWEPRLAEIGPLIAAGFQMDGMTNGRLILLNPALQNDDQQMRRTLCHEIVHVAIKGQTAEEHGPLFQSRLRQLAEQGAFTGTVASEEEKQELRGTVAARADELKKSVASLNQARSELDAELQRPQPASPSPSDAAAEDLRRRNLEIRTIDYNFSVQRHNNGVEDLNRLIEQYNLMVSYPDGLDRERLAHRPVFAEAR
jgi:hypothetical protein